MTPAQVLAGGSGEEAFTSQLNLGMATRRLRRHSTSCYEHSTSWKAQILFCLNLIDSLWLVTINLSDGSSGIIRIGELLW